jgi:sugar phosphate isomerase/epimerase
MKIGFYTSTFNDRPIEETLDFAVEAGFDAIELDAGGHIKTPERVSDVVEQARSRGLSVSSIALFGGQLDPNVIRQADFRRLTAEFAVAIGQAKVPLFVLFGGYDPSLSEDKNYGSFASHAQELLAVTAESELDFALENWPGPDDRFIAVTPLGWQRVFASVPDRRFGIEFDPSHLLRLGIDPYAALDGVHDRIKILHAKDTAIDRDRLQMVGYHGAGWWRYCLPGRGLLDWPRFLRHARQLGFDGTLSIEHEDADFGWPGGDLKAREVGATQTLNFLRTTLRDL